MFIGRNQELTALNKLYQEDSFQFAVIYGRRRIGKTSLINQFLKGKRAIYFTGLEENALENLARFSDAIHAYEDPSYLDGPNFASFEQAFKYLVHLSEKNDRLILVIDEFPYLAKAIRQSVQCCNPTSTIILNRTNSFLSSAAAPCPSWKSRSLATRARFMAAELPSLS